jgi:hypothetical protein
MRPTPVVDDGALSVRPRLVQAGNLLQPRNRAMAVVARASARPYIADIPATSRKPRMTSFDDRERAFENKFARDADTEFRIIARRNRLLGEWAAARMGLTAEETDSYAKSVVQAEFEEMGDEDVVRKLIADLARAGVETSDEEVRAALEAKQVEARRHFIEGI